MVDITLVQAQIGSYFAIISTNTVRKIMPILNCVSDIHRGNCQFKKKKSPGTLLVWDGS